MHIFIITLSINTWASAGWLDSVQEEALIRRFRLNLNSRPLKQMSDSKVIVSKEQREAGNTVVECEEEK